MFHHRAALRTKRSVIVAGGVAAVLLPLGVAGPAVAQEPAPAAAAASAPSAVSEKSAIAEVDEFYDGYITSLGEGDTNRAEKLRQSSIRGDYLTKLEQWEEQHQTDGVLRSQNVPVGFDVAYDGSGAGHSWSIVTLQWDGQEQQDTRLHVQTDLATGEISGIKPVS